MLWIASFTDSLSKSMLRTPPLLLSALWKGREMREKKFNQVPFCCMSITGKKIYSIHTSVLFQVPSYLRKFDFHSFSIALDFFSSSTTPRWMRAQRCKVKSLIEKFCLVSIKWKLIKIKTSIWNRSRWRRISCREC